MRFNTTRSVLCVAVALLAAAASGSMASTYYVSPSGSDTNNGSQSAPFGDILTAVQAAAAGDTIVVEDGTYTGQNNVNVPVSQDGLTIESVDGPGSTIIDCQMIAGGFLTEANIAAITIIGLQIQNAVIASGQAGGAIYNTGPLNIINCNFVNDLGGEGGAVYNWQYSTITLDGDIFYGNGADDSGGAFENDGTATVVNSTFAVNSAYDVDGGGIENTGTLTLDFSSFYGNSAGIYGGALCGEIGSSSQVVDGIFWDDTASTGNEVSNAGTGTVTHSDVDGGEAGTGNIDTDPMYVDPFYGNLDIEAGSPVTAAGAEVNGITTDLNGVVRGDPPTMGAFEGATNHVLWRNTSGALSLWSYNPPTGLFSQNSFGPYADWTPEAIADGPDGLTRALWVDTSGEAAIWTVDNGGNVTQFSFGPFKGWAATGISVGSDNTTHILWTSTAGAASIWNYNTETGSYTQNSYGPYNGWIPGLIADGLDGDTRLVWTNGGAASIWSLNDTTGEYTEYTFGPYKGWSITGLSVDASDTTHVMWTSTGGAAAVWNYDTSNGSITTQNTYGPFAGWTPASVADGPDGNTQLVWNSSAGASSIWDLDNVSGSFIQSTSGPFSGWSNIAIDGYAASGTASPQARLRSFPQHPKPAL
ncbi:MAG: hypothetical protein ACLQVD_10700 [Capsulimonadaceae bacterium]